MFYFCSNSSHITWLSGFHLISSIVTEEKIFKQYYVKISIICIFSAKHIINQQISQHISYLSCNESTVQISFHLVRNYAIFGSEFVFYHCGLFIVRAAMLDDGGS
jgi:hypothetical protein